MVMPYVSDRLSATIKAYVDGRIEGLITKGSARALAAANVASLSGTTTIDGVSLVADDVVVLTAQTTGTENGAWQVKASTWERPDNFAAGSSAAASFWFITEGTTYADTRWWCTDDAGSDVVGTDALTIEQFSGATEITAGDGLQKTGNTLAVAADVERTTNKDAANGYLGLDADERASPANLTLTDHLATLSGTYSQAASTAATTVTGCTLDRTAFGGAVVQVTASRGTTRMESGLLVIAAPTGASPSVSSYLGSIGTPGLTWTVSLSGDTVSLQLATDGVDANATDVRYTMWRQPVP